MLLASLWLPNAVIANIYHRKFRVNGYKTLKNHRKNKDNPFHFDYVSS
jgi:hypothetical protein